MQFSLSEGQKRILLIVIHAVLILSGLIYIGGIADQASFSPYRLCLLYTRGWNEGIFIPDSPVCHTTVSIQGFGILFSLVLIVTRLYSTPAPLVTIIFGSIAAIWTLIAIVNTAVVHAGLNSTCSQLEAFNHNRLSCASAFSLGFSTTDSPTRYSKNLTTVLAAIGSGWVNATMWALYTVYEYFEYRSTLKA